MTNLAYKNPVIKTVGALCLIGVLSACGEGASSPSAANVATDTLNAVVTTPIDVAANNVIAAANPSSVISGDISILDDGLPVGEILIRVRDTDIQTQRQASGEFFLVVDASETERAVTLDISGDNIVEKSVSVQIPANAERSILNTTVASRTPPITFNLDAGGNLRNEESSTRTTVTVPANAFQFADGTVATGMAEVSITELDILDLEADYSWAPNFIGIAAGTSQRSAITTFGMSEFHFSQNGQELDLRPGVNATLSMDLALPYVITSDSDTYVDPTPGAIMPLWYYDIEDLVWKEEGHVSISADAQSETGFKASGDVSHFSYWNIDWVAPFLEADIHVLVVDQYGAPRNDVEVLTYHTLVRIPPEDGWDAHRRLSTWQNSDVLTPQSNNITIMGNISSRFVGVAEANLDLTNMDVLVSDVTTKDHGIISTGVMLQKKSFIEGSGDLSVYFEVEMATPPDPTPEMMSADIVIQLVDLEGSLITGLTVSSFTVSAEASTGWFNRNIRLTPARSSFALLGNTPEFLEFTDTPVETHVTLDELIVDGVGEIEFLTTHTESRYFNTVTGNNVIVYAVPVVDF